MTLGRKNRNFFAIAVICLVGTLSLLALRHFGVLGLQSIPRWSIGRYIFNERFEITEDQPNPVYSVKDLRFNEAEFVADPFVFPEADSLYLFYELGLKSPGTGWTGVIGLASSQDGVSWNDLGVVLSDTVILSFPVIYREGNAHYMTVESAAANNLRLFKANRFPASWECVDTLMAGQWSDPVIYKHEGIYYLFVSKPKFHDLHLFYANSIHGPYREHPQSPVVKDAPSRGRNAGVIFELNGSLYRPVQDCSRMYGEKVRMMQITELSTFDYTETEIQNSPVLAGSGAGWNKKKMHTFNVYRSESSRLFVITDGTTVDYDHRIRIGKGRL